MAAGNSTLTRRGTVYSTGDGQMVVADAFGHVSTALAATGNEAASIDSGAAEIGRFKVVTANVTGTVNVVIQTSQDNATWITSCSTTAIGNATTYLAGLLMRYVRVSWIIVTGPADVAVTADLV